MGHYGWPGRFRRFRAALLVLGCVTASGCTSAIDEVPPSLGTMRVLRDQGVPRMALGAFIPASREIGRAITIRISVLHAPKGRTFAEFVGATFETD